MKYISLSEAYRKRRLRHESELRIIAIMTNMKPCEHEHRTTIPEHFDETVDGTIIEVAEQDVCLDCKRYVV